MKVCCLAVEFTLHLVLYDLCYAIVLCSCVMVCVVVVIAV